MIHRNKFLTSLLILLLVLLLKSCSDEPNQPTYFRGQLPDLKNDSIFLYSVDSYHPGLMSEHTIDATICDDEGNFLFEINNLHKGYYQIITSKYPRLTYDIYIAPGDSLSIFQSSWNATPSFEVIGKGSDKLVHLKDDYETFPRSKEFFNTIRSDRFKTSSDFKFYIDSIQQGRIALALSQPISDSIKAKFITDIKLESATYLLEHLQRRNYTMNDEFSYHMPESSYYSSIDDLVEDTNFNSSTAKMFLRPYLEFIFQKEQSDSGSMNQSNIAQKLDFIKRLESGPFKDQLALAVLNEFSLAMFEDDFFKTIKSFKVHIDANFSDTSYQTIFDNNFNTFLVLEPGANAPDFELPDPNGTLVKLSDFKGQIVYIDFWGTWCYPCIVEIPNSIKLQEEFKNDNVTFLFVALESDNKQIETWKNFISGNTEQFKQFLTPGYFPGNHLVAEKQFNNPELSAYKLNFAPTYVLIDQEGKLVDARAARPSEISDDIKALLDKSE